MLFDQVAEGRFYVIAVSLNTTIEWDAVKVEHPPLAIFRYSLSLSAVRSS